MTKGFVVNPFDLLTMQQKKLVEVFLETGDETEAKKASGLTYSGKNPFRAVNVRRAINHAMRPKFDKAGISFENHLEYVAAIAYGDPSELSEVIDVNCRYCNGIDFKYQWTNAEYVEAIEETMQKYKSRNGIVGQISQQELEDHGYKPPSCEGGFNFDKYADPHPNCPECAGHGVQSVRVHPSAVSHPLFAGVVVNKNGDIEVKLRNQDAAMQHVSKLQGYLIDKVEVTTVSHVDKLNEARKRAKKAVTKKKEDV